MKLFTQDDVLIISRNHLSYANAWHILIGFDYYVVSIEDDDHSGVHETVAYYANSRGKAETRGTGTEYTNRALTIDWSESMLYVSHWQAIDALLLKINKSRRFNYDDSDYFVSDSLSVHMTCAYGLADAIEKIAKVIEHNERTDEIAVPQLWLMISKGHIEPVEITHGASTTYDNYYIRTDVVFTHQGTEIARFAVTSDGTA